MSYDDDRSDRWRRKERILHTRISEELEEDLRRAAEDLRVPVSNLVRNVLEEAVTVVEAVSGEVSGLIDDVVESAEGVAQRLAKRPGRDAGARRGRWTEAARAARTRAGEPAGAPPAKILGWQAVVLHEAQRCACGRELAAGSPAHLALTPAGPAAFYRCADCITGLGAKPAR